ncbi:hypothetical protein [Ascidiaceihabitans sp.]|uniref:hypothetical protein n=1 Tax=Ascidiaceihabitans sp. TaxID=1872644 RepID=UPI003298601E
MRSGALSIAAVVSMVSAIALSAEQAKQADGLTTPHLAMATDAAIAAFTGFCFKAGQSPDQARQNMEKAVGSPLPFELTFWDSTRAPAPDAPGIIERRCEVAWPGQHTAVAIVALRSKMAEPPVFGTQTALPETHQSLSGTALIEGRALLRGRIAVVHVGTRDTAGVKQTFIAVDRLPADWQTRLEAKA